MGDILLNLLVANLVIGFFVHLCYTRPKAERWYSWRDIETLAFVLMIIFFVATIIIGVMMGFVYLIALIGLTFAELVKVLFKGKKTLGDWFDR